MAEGERVSREAMVSLDQLHALCVWSAQYRLCADAPGITAAAGRPELLVHVRFNEGLTAPRLDSTAEVQRLEHLDLEDSTGKQDGTVADRAAWQSKMCTHHTITPRQCLGMTRGRRYSDTRPRIDTGYERVNVRAKPKRGGSLHALAVAMHTS